MFARTRSHSLPSAVGTAVIVMMIAVLALCAVVPSMSVAPACTPAKTGTLACSVTTTTGQQHLVKQAAPVAFEAQHFGYVRLSLVSNHAYALIAGVPGITGSTLSPPLRA